MRRKEAEAGAAGLRAAYDLAIAEGGIVFLQQTAAGSNTHHTSASVRELLGHDPGEFLQPGRLRDLVHVDDLKAFRTIASDPDAEAPVIRLRHADGHWRSFRIGVLDDGLDRPLHLTLVDVDNDVPAATRRRRAEHLLDLSDDAVVLLELSDLDDPASLRVADLNPAALQLLGRDTPGSLAEVFGSSSLQLLRSAAFDSAHTGEHLVFDRLQFAELPTLRLELRFDRLPDGIVAMRMVDVTHQATLEDHLRHRALHDQRTGLANLAMLVDRLGEAARGAPQVLGLLAIDLQGSPVSDALLAEVARRVADTMAPATLVARVGETRLAVLLPPLGHDAELSSLAQSAAAAVALPLDVNGEAVDAMAVVGAASAEHDSAPHQLLRDAETAATRAAFDGLPWAIASDLAPTDHRTGLFARVRAGIAEGEMELRYQPIIDLRSGRVAKVEALLRWRSGAGQPPPAMLDLAERSGLVVPLARWMLGEAAAAATDLQQLQPGLRVAVNLSSLGNGEDLDGFLRLLAADGIDPTERLEVEISETTLADNPLRAAELVSRLRAAGLSVVIDDFGAGYTSLSTVSGLALNGLKIDRSFIATLTSIPADAAVVASTIEFCHQLGIQVTAIGVADEPTLTHLRELRCDLAQGFLLSEPVTLDQLAGRIGELERAYT